MREDIHLTRIRPSITKENKNRKTSHKNIGIKKLSSQTQKDSVHLINSESTKRKKYITNHYNPS
jgi:hypothetical protein